ncbi:signal peptidase II [bacterium endosymbiont of Pedicinus badii]|uniref:signal peptidase II n=1 Tax=bacterium endosymbiont of Pedicinus badii TaxID=1719126 RepID=UPI0018A8637A|nr:signal peptidase II [bacterium endosymbiont of Pedicinus badii]
MKKEKLENFFRKNLKNKKIFFIIIIFLLDISSKFLINVFFQNVICLRIFSFLNIVLVHNEGIAFGLLSNLPKWKIFFICGINFFFLFIILVNTNIEKKNSVFKIVNLEYELIFGGAIGNFFERIFFKKVTDFIDFHINEYHFPTFNLADTFIFIGIFIILYKNFLQKKL